MKISVQRTLVQISQPSSVLLEFLVFLQDKTLRENDLAALRKQIEREYLEKINLEDQIMERLRTQLTLDKAAQYSKKLTGRSRDRTKHLVSLSATSSSIALHPQRPWGLLGTRGPGWPPQLHAAPELCLFASQFVLVIATFPSFSADLFILRV